MSEINWLDPKTVHDIVEEQAFEFLASIGINGKRIRKETYSKTPDYAFKNIAIEASIIHDYDPPSQDSLKQFLGDNTGNYYLTYG